MSCDLLLLSFFFGFSCGKANILGKYAIEIVIHLSCCCPQSNPNASKNSAHCVYRCHPCTITHQDVKSVPCLCSYDKHFILLVNFCVFCYWDDARFFFKWKCLARESHSVMRMKSVLHWGVGGTALCIRICWELTVSITKKE